jgi:hypothetical protein
MEALVVFIISAALVRRRRMMNSWGVQPIVSLKSLLK